MPICLDLMMLDHQSFADEQVNYILFVVFVYDLTCGVILFIVLR